MHEFCPSCAQNGITSKIKAYQLNCEDAVCMCSAQNCTWPVGVQQVIFFKRPLGKDWTRDWDRSESMYIKNEHNAISELSSYTPPQTPGSEGKDNVNIYTTCSTTVPENVFDCTFDQENVNKFTGPTTMLTEPCNVSVNAVNDNISLKEKSSVINSNLITGISNNSDSDLFKDSDNLNFKSKLNVSNFELLTETNDNVNFIVSKNTLDVKPKITASEFLQNHVVKLVTKGNTTMKNNANNMFSENCEKMPNVDNCKATSLTNKSLFIKSKSISNRLSIIKSSRKLRSDQGSKILNFKKITDIPYQKFDFNEIMMKAKSTNLKIDNKLNVKDECQDEEKSEKYSKILSQKENECSFDFDLNEICNSNDINVKKDCNKVKVENVNELITTNFVTNSQIDFDSILGLTTCSKDSGVDQDLLEGDVDFHLDDLLTNISQDTNNLSKCEMGDIDDYKWIDSLFE